MMMHKPFLIILKILLKTVVCMTLVCDTDETQLLCVNDQSQLNVLLVLIVIYEIKRKVYCKRTTKLKR